MNNVVQQSGRDSAKHLVRYAASMVNRTILEQYASIPGDECKQEQHHSREDTCITCMEEDIHMPSQVESNKSFNSVSKRSLMFNSRKSVIFTKLELSTCKKEQKTAYQIDTGSDGN